MDEKQEETKPIPNVPEVKEEFDWKKFGWKLANAVCIALMVSLSFLAGYFYCKDVDMKQSIQQIVLERCPQGLNNLVCADTATIVKYGLIPTKNG